MIPERDANTLEIDYTEPFAPNVKRPVPLPPDPARMLTQGQLCSAVASVAKAHDLPIPFFANLIWSESNFESETISRAGAQGIAQFMPRTAVEYGLLNPFEPIHALNVAGKFLRELHEQFGNLGLAAAAYNAGPRRVANWMTKGGALPRETRKYVLKITGRPAHQWIAPDVQNDPEAALMPAKAPCVEVAEAVKEQERVVRISKLMMELAEATLPAPETQLANKADTPETKQADAKPDHKAQAVRMAKAAIKASDGKERRATSAKTAARTADKSTDKSAGKTAAKPSPKDKVAVAAKTAAEPAGRSKGEAETKTEADAKAAASESAKTEASTASNQAAKETAKSEAVEAAKSEPIKQAATRPRVTRRTQFAHSAATQFNW